MSPWRHSGAQRALNRRGIRRRAAGGRRRARPVRRRGREFAGIEQRRAVDRALDRYQAVR